jgi:phosphorylcholine metabolism protein LicD
MKAENITTGLLILLIILIIYTQRNDFLCKMENFENTEFDKFPNMTCVQDIELKKLLKIIHIVLTQNKIEYSMCGGTLLGAIRHKNRIPWDNNGDIFIFDKDEDKIEQIDWSKYGCKLFKNLIGYKLFFEDGKSVVENDNKMDWNYPFVNIFVVTKQSEKSISNKQTSVDKSLSKKFDSDKDIWKFKNEKYKNFLSKDYLYDSELFPLKLYQFGDIMLYGPNQVYSYLTRCFGDGWETNVTVKILNTEKNLEYISFSLNESPKKYNLKPIKYLWIIGTSEKYSKDYLINKFNDDYTLVFINNDNIDTYLPDIDIQKEEINLKISKDIKIIRKLLFKKYGGKFIIFE